MTSHKNVHILHDLNYLSLSLSNTDTRTLVSTREHMGSLTQPKALTTYFGLLKFRAEVIVDVCDLHTHAHTQRYQHASFIESSSRNLNEQLTYWSIILQLPEPFSFIFTWFAAIPVILWLSSTLTKVIVKDFLILKVRAWCVPLL